MVLTLGVAVTITLEIGDVTPFVRGGLMHHAGADGQFVSERPHLPVVIDPVVALFVSPFVSVESLPLRTHVPAKRNRSAPQYSASTSKCIIR